MGQPCALSWGGLLWRSFRNPKKQHVDRNGDKAKAALTSPAQHCCHNTSLAVIKALGFQREVLLVRLSSF